MELSTDIIILLKSPTIGEAISPIRVSAIPPAILQLAPGSDVRADVLGRMLNGQTLMRVAGELLTMELPESVTPGSSLRMTFLGREPRPTFSLSLQQNSAAPVTISETGRWLGQILQGTADEASRPEQLNRLTRLMDGPPADTTRLAASLREALSTSGLFYESHLAEWAAGERDLSSIMKEPQAALGRQGEGAPATGDLTAGAAPATAERGPAAASPSPSTEGGATAPQPAEADSSPQRMQSEPATSETKGTVRPGEPRPVETSPATDLQPGRDATVSGRTAAPERPGDPTPGGQRPAPLPAGTEPAAIRPGTAAAQTPVTTPGARGEATAASGPPPQPALPAEASPSATNVPLPAGPSAIPERPAPGQPPTPPSTALPTPQPTPANVPVREQLPTTTAAPLESDAGVTASRQQPALSAQHQAGPPQPLQQNEPTAADGTDRAAHPQLARSAQDTATSQQAPRPEVADPRTAPVIREQLAALNNGIIAWNGEAWPGQPLQWQVEDREARHRDSSEGRWHSELRVDLPNLGRVITSLKVRGKELHLSFTVDNDATTALMQQEAPHLEDQLSAAGLKLANLVIRHGKKK